MKHYVLIIFGDQLWIHFDYFYKLNLPEIGSGVQLKYRVKKYYRKHSQIRLTSSSSYPISLLLSSIVVNNKKTSSLFFFTIRRHMCYLAYHIKESNYSNCEFTVRQSWHEFLRKVKFKWVFFLWQNWIKCVDKNSQK